MPHQPSAPANRAATIKHLQRNASALAGEAIARMDATLPWYGAMSAQLRSWVGVVAQNGITSFIDWYRQPANPPSVSADIFRSAPREMARAVTLQQTVELVRTTIAVIEEHVDSLPQPHQRADLRDAVLLYSREVAFAAAAVYAQAAESRGAWDARLEALVVDALVRNDSQAGLVDPGLRSRAAALGWGAPRWVCTVVGSAPSAPAGAGKTPQAKQADQLAAQQSDQQSDQQAPPAYTPASVQRLQRTARGRGLEVLTGVHGTRLLAIVGSNDPDASTLLGQVEGLAGLFGPGSVVIGPLVHDLLQAGSSIAEALSGLHAVTAWPQAPCPVSSEALLPERALAGDEAAKKRLVDNYFSPIHLEKDLLLTVAVYLEQATTVEATARQLFIHPNTVRYRLRRVSELTGATLTDPRDTLKLRLALILGRMHTDPAG